MMSFICSIVLFSVVFSGTLQAQYRTESWNLAAGWNAIYLNVDPGNELLDTLLAGNLSITEVWQWRPSGLDPSLDAPLGASSGTGTDEWRVWRRGDPANSSFAILSPNTAYNILTVSDSTLSLKGRVVAPQVRWRTDGANLIGFPINGTYQLASYLAGSGIVDENTEVYRDVGGDLGPTNPAQVPARLVLAKRGEAFWIRSHKFSDFYGPFSVDVALESGLHFGAVGSVKRLVVRNRTDATITVTLATVASETKPGETSAPPMPTLLTRELDATSGLYNYTPFASGTTLTIPPRESVGLSLSVDRASMPGNPGAQFASLLRLTDGGGKSDIYFPITAQKGSLAGLWVGEAQISKVQNQLQRFQREDDDTYSVDADGKHIPISSETGLNKTAQDFKIRLLLHVDAAGKATLLSHVYAGIISDDGAGTTLTGITTRESTLHASHLKTAVRLTSAHWPTNLAQPMTGTVTPGGALTTTVSLGANHPSNPFLHTYHPDHDNKDAHFENLLPAGIESHNVERAVTLTVNAAASAGEGPQWGTSLLSGTFTETVTGIHKQPIAVSGIFAIGKVSDISSLTP